MTSTNTTVFFLFTNLEKIESSQIASQLFSQRITSHAASKVSGRHYYNLLIIANENVT